MKKTIFAVLLILSVLFAFCACGSGETPDSGEAPGSGETPDGTTGGETPAEKTKYTVTWIDKDGETISTGLVEEGTVPSCSYSVSDTAEWDYTFTGWATSENGEALASIPAVSGNVTYYARVSAVKQEYTVVFNTQGGSAVASQTVEYGKKATAPESPTYSGHRFMGWSYTSSGSEIVDFDKVITGNTEYYAVWNTGVDPKVLLATLLESYEVNPFAYIPESMRGDYSANLVDADDIVTDYSSFVNTSDIAYGHGEQWHMVVENLEQSKTFFNVLSVIDTLTTTSVAAFNNYIDQNPSDTAHHEFKSGIYSVTINFDGTTIAYVLDYTADLPVLGTQTVQIALKLNSQTNEKTARIQLGDANALTYRTVGNSYEFAIKYMGVRRAMFSVEIGNGGVVNGKIYEYLTVSGVDIASAAEFFISDGYVSVVGNKASGMVGFTGYITELYSAISGRLIGYEVQEKISALVYNTLWFDLKEVSGISSVKYQEKNGETEAKIFVNGKSTELLTVDFGGATLKHYSRRFDIEFRTQYVYSYDAATEKYTEHEIQVPMLFVQEEKYDTFSADILASNGIIASIGVSNAKLDRILSDYDTLIPVFIQNKDSITSDSIVAYIGNKVTFE